ncbi:TetR/AcrR family transcriptional regulator [Aquibacillus rhizosphaerae]|uniref:TetR/AcrR family transcriptional regulator n=1 Tax=Aquibacillus rhizosphaerae TaxID=3051431 RepID=A0ABT7L4V0_9BACI|nr:TetR/AcrR family transcriptional regulator [Aquibacillus sp. LR5S19]MDL4840888.1 TetR/AcrR family transcriptional regulator [Aquibacillus sp. LR5S19]
MDGFERRRKVKESNILQGALDLFMQFGVQKVSIAEIAKKANVSQVTIYNYFESKHNLTQEVLIYYLDTVWIETEQLLDSDMDFPDKIKQLIFNKKEAANQMNKDFYTYFIKEYASGITYIEELYTKKMLPRLIKLLNEGKEKGYIDSAISNEAILVYIQMLKESMQQETMSQQILPFADDITKLIFYGLIQS